MLRRSIANSPGLARRLRRIVMSQGICPMAAFRLQACSSSIACSPKPDLSGFPDD